MNNNTFNLKRIAHLLKKEFSENRRLILYALSGIFVVITIVQFIPIITKNAYYQQSEMLAYYYIGAFLISPIAANFAFSNLHNKSSAVSQLTLPASSLEKFLSKFLIYTILFILAYTLIFYCINIVAKNYYIENFVNKYSGSYVFQPLKRKHKSSIISLIAFVISIQFIFYIGSIYFKRYNYLLSFLIALALFLFVLAIYNYTQYGMLKEFYADTLMTYTNEGLFVEQIKNSVPVEKFYSIPKWLTVFISIVTYMGIIFLFVIAWFKLKEREVK